MLLRRLLVPAVASTALVCAAAVPASADPADPLAGTYTVTMTGATTGVFLNGLQIVAACAITSTGVVAASVVESCYLEGTGGDSHSAALSGNAAAVGFTQRVYTLEFQLCYSGYVVPVTDPAAQHRVSDCAGFPADIEAISAGLTQETY